MNRRPPKALVLGATALFAVIAAVVLLGDVWQPWLDRKGIEDYARDFSQMPTPPALSGAPAASLAWLDSATSPKILTPHISSGAPIEVDGATAETWTFEPARRGGPATFFVLRHGEIGASPAFIWLPGNGFGPIAYPFVGHFYDAMFEAGYDVVVWVPPYHVSRADPSGRGILTNDTAENQQILLASVAEVRMMARYLRTAGVKRMGGWGGSMGAAILWLASALEKFDLMSLMIPVVDWRTITLAPEMNPLLEALEAAGTSRAVIDQTYLAISPVAYTSLTPGDAIQIQLARYDQLNPEGSVRDFAREKGITQVDAYDRGHATILVSWDLYQDFAAFLRRMD
ncbi:MAG: hypothetical protein R3E66_20565 [bacterium]